MRQRWSSVCQTDPAADAIRRLQAWKSDGSSIPGLVQTIFHTRPRQSIHAPAKGRKAPRCAATRLLIANLAKTADDLQHQCPNKSRHIPCPSLFPDASAELQRSGEL